MSQIRAISWITLPSKTQLFPSQVVSGAQNLSLSPLQSFWAEKYEHIVIKENQILAWITDHQPRKCRRHMWNPSHMEVAQNNDLQLLKFETCFACPIWMPGSILPLTLHVLEPVTSWQIVEATHISAALGQASPAIELTNLPICKHYWVCILLFSLMKVMKWAMEPLKVF